MHYKYKNRTSESPTQQEGFRTKCDIFLNMLTQNPPRVVGVHRSASFLYEVCNVANGGRIPGPPVFVYVLPHKYMT